MTNVESSDRDLVVEVQGYQVAVDRMYHPETHMWVQQVAPGQVRIGMDPLGIETSGTLAQLSFVEAGAAVLQGRAFGQLEAAKFVGPLVSPLTGTVARTNHAVTADPGVVERDPYGEGWLVELSAASEEELAGLLSASDEITSWFGHTVDEYRLKGVIAQ